MAKDRLGEVPADLTKAIADFKKRTTEVLAQLSVSPEDANAAPSRYADQLSGLYFTISGGNAAPTPTMKDNFELLQKDFPARIADVNRFADEDVAKFNQTLQKYGLPMIIVGKKVEVAK